MAKRKGSAHASTYIPERQQLSCYLHSSSYAWYEDQTLKVVVIMKGDICEKRHNIVIHSKD
jgi:hypothetical protein